jgi:hypothetical protein
MSLDAAWCWGDVSRSERTCKRDVCFSWTFGCSQSDLLLSASADVLLPGWLVWMWHEVYDTTTS